MSGGSCSQCGGTGLGWDCSSCEDHVAALAARVPARERRRRATALARAGRAQEAAWWLAARGKVGRPGRGLVRREIYVRPEVYEGWRDAAAATGVGVGAWLEGRENDDAPTD